MCSNRADTAEEDARPIGDLQQQLQDWRSLINWQKARRRVAFRLADVDLGRTDPFLDIALIAAVIDIPARRIPI